MTEKRSDGKIPAFRSDRKEMSFCLMGDGNQELVLADPERYERPDVAQALEADFGEFLPGFRLWIREAAQRSLL